MMHALYLCVFSTLIVHNIAQLEQSNKYLICKPAADVFTRGFEPEAESSAGTSGLSGSFDSAERDAQYHHIKQELKEIKDQLKCFDGVVVDCICYRLLYRVGVRVTYSQASNLCSFHGGLLVEIPTEEVYLAVFNYVRRAWSVDLELDRRNFVQIFLNSQYNRGEVTLRSGEQAYLHWHPRYPTTNRSHRQMLMSITTNTNHPGSENGMFNFNSDYTAVPLCQFTLV